MNWPVVILLVFFALATLFVLARGVINMAQQKDLTGERSQQLMQKRILYQAIAIGLAVILLLMASN